MNTIRNLALAATASLVLAACASVETLTPTQIATLDDVALTNSVKASDIDTADRYVSHTECEILGGAWGTGLGGIGVSGASFPACSLSGASGGQPYTGPTIVGRSGTVLN